MKPTLFRRLRDRGIRPDDLRVDGARKRLEKSACPSTIGWKVSLLGPDAGSDDPVAGAKIGRQSAGNTKTDDARTATPGPRAMRASNARQVTATTCPLVDIQLSFCSRSASAYFGGNLPQKAKLVNGLALDLPSRDGSLAAKTRLPGAAPRRAFFRA